jgi:hypothetical protein
MFFVNVWIIYRRYVDGQDSIGCLSSVTKGAYCGGAGCLIGNEYEALRGITLKK